MRDKRATLDRLKRNLPDKWWENFEQAGPNSAKIRCVRCFATGWGSLYPDWTEGITPWQLRCLAGHEARCDECGRWFVDGTGLAHHRRCKSGHTSCHDHTTTHRSNR